jgi:hypothetical protein
MTNPLSIELFKETLPWALTVQLMKLETPLKTINNWYTWVATLNHKHHKLTWAIEQTRGTLGKEKSPQQKFYFLWKKRDPNAMDVDRLTVDEQNWPWQQWQQEEKGQGRALKEDEQKGALCSRTGPIQGNDGGRQGWVFERSRRSRFLRRRVASTSVSPYLDIYSVTIANISQNSISVPINICSSKQIVETLIDSSTSGMFIDQNFVKNFEINYLDKSVKAYNVDGMENKQGTINAYVNLKFKEQFYVTGLGKQRIILGFPWLHKYNLIIDWKKGEIIWKPFWINWRCLMEKGKQIWMKQQPKIEEVVDKEEPNNQTTLPLEEDKLGVYIKLLETDVWIHKTNIIMELAIEENSKKMDKTDEQLVPAEYHKYLNIFRKEKAHHFFELRPWDHKIKMKEGFEPKLFKNYNLTPAEQIELDKFLKENLKKGYIRPFQLPMASPFFFVSKKDSKLWPCQDYQYLND